MPARARPSLDPAFAKRMQELIAKGGPGGTALNVTEAATIARVTVAAFQNYLKGRLPQPSQAKSIAQGFGVSLSWLLEGGSRDDARVAIAPQRIALAIDIIGGDLENLALDVGASIEEMNSWVSGSSAPTQQQFSNLFTSLTRAAATLHSAIRSNCQHSQSDLADREPRRQGNEY